MVMAGPARNRGAPCRAMASQRALSSADPGLPFSGFYRMSDLQAETRATQRIEVALLTSMAGLALLLSAVGIFALVANMVAQRTREIGIRMALGAQEGTVRRLVVREAMALAVAGVAIGMIAAFFLSRSLVASLLFSTSPRDPLTFTAVATVLTAVALVSSYIPARRATRVDPMIALRAD